MKANEAPEKIYIQKGINYNNIFEYDSKWTPIPLINEYNVEYTRTDAFIEKACKFLSNKANIPLWEGYAHTFGCDTTKLVDEFRKYMKRE